MKNISHKQNERLSYIDFSANFLGQIGRNDIVKRFGISDAAASKDLADYIKTAPKNLTYDFKTKNHRPTKNFKPVFSFPSNQALKALSTGIGDTLEQTPESYLPSEVAPQLNQPDAKVLAQISRAIHLKKILKVNYWSLSSGITERTFAPFAIVDSGLRWHIRSFDRKRNEFRDFLFSRIKSAEILEDEKLKEGETPECDLEWNRTIILKIVPHPINVTQPEAIIMDYDMQEGCLEIKQRAATAQYLLRNWNIDCTIDHSLKERYYQLWLANRDEIIGIENFQIAPGIHKN